MRNKLYYQKMQASLIMLLATIGYLLFNCCGCVRSTGSEETDTLLEQIADAYPQDNVLEEILEQKIKNQTGIDFDLTPLSREN